MKRISTRLYLLGIATLMFVAGGCATTKQTENLLSAAGFKVVPATTPQQQTHLKTLPPHKVTQVQRDGKIYFVYPDAAQQVLYVGQDAQFQQYQKLRLQNQMAQEQLEAAELNSDPAWGTWGAWGGGMAVPVLR